MPRIKENAMVIFACLVSYIDYNGWPPSVTELAGMSYYSRSVVSNALVWLEANRYIRRGKNHEVRAIAIIPQTASISNNSHRTSL